MAQHWREQVGYDLYPVLRLILPQKDRERAIYGLKEKNLAKAYIKLIPLGSKDPDAIQLLNWKKPSDRYVRNFHYSYKGAATQANIFDDSEIFWRFPSRPIRSRQQAVFCD